MSSGKRADSIEAAAVRDQLVRIRASDILSGAERLRRFLSFVVEETLEGRSAQIKEYVVGVEVYGRPGTYDPRTDSIVRVEASKLRTRLQQYYDTVGRNDRIIITIPKGGYVPAFENRQTAQRPVGSFLPHPWRLTIAGGVIGLALGLAAFVVSPDRSRAPIPLPIALTTYKGQQRAPSISPEGSRVAFSWDGADEANFSIYVKPLDSPSPMRLTTAGADDNYPAWSPDGRRLAFTRNGQLYIIPAEGGRESRITPASGISVVWTRDGLGIVISDRESDSWPFAAWVVSLRDGSRRQITHPPAGSFGDYNFSLSPEGRSLVFTRQSANFASSDLYLIPIAGGSERRLTNLNNWIFGSTFLPGGDQILFSTRRSDEPSLWRLRLSTMTQDLISDVPALLPSAAPARSGNGATVVFQSKALSVNMVEIDPASQARKPIAPTTRIDALPQYSPDGSRIAFASNREGAWAIFLSDRNGAILRKVAPLSGYEGVGAPRWSPDGVRLVYDARRAGASHIAMIDLKSGDHHMLTHGESVDVRPSWSLDGRAIYFASNRSGARQVWKIPAAGGEPAQITRGGGFAPVESPDGRAVFYVKTPAEQGLWRTLPSGGPEVLVCKGVADGLWSVARDGVKSDIYFIEQAYQEKAPKKLARCDPESGREVTILDLEKGGGLYPGLSISNDGRVLYTSQTTRSELMMIDGLR
jgi:Tol biopolymer transport system component